MDTFEVIINRNSLGLGFSIMGGPEAPHPFKNLIRIKKVFPLQPAWETGKIKAGDLLHSVDGIALESMTLREALDVLRSSSKVTRLIMSRAPNSQLEDLFLHPNASTPNRDNLVSRSYSYNPSNRDSLSPFAPGGPESIGVAPCRGSQVEDDSVRSFSEGQAVLVDDNFHNQTWTFGQKKVSTASHEFDVLCSVLSENEKSYGEFTVKLKKVNGSLGFTLCQTDDTTVLRHTVKALVKEPAISDGRIKPGDKLIAANGVDCCLMTHSELITFLRKCPEEVNLNVYRDASRSQTPVSPLSDGPNGIFAKSAKATQSHPNLPSFLHGRTGSNSSSGRPGNKRLLRYEAKEMVKSLQASRSSLESSMNSHNGHLGSRPGSNASSGSAAGRIRRLGRPYSPKTPLSLSTSAPTPSPLISSATKHPLLMKEVHSFDDDYCLVETPTEVVVESPCTPVAKPPSFQTDITETENHMHQLKIEELPPSPEPKYQDVQMGDNLIEVPEQFQSARHPVAPPRPEHLDLLKSNNRRAKAFMFAYNNNKE